MIFVVQISRDFKSIGPLDQRAHPKISRGPVYPAIILVAGLLDQRVKNLDLMKWAQWVRKLLNLNRKIGVSDPCFTELGPYLL